MAINFSNVQGNILKGFGKPNARLIFFRFGDNNQAKQWLSKLADKLPSTQKLIGSAQEIRDKKEALIHVSLSAQGIQSLNLKLPTSDNDPFAVGMKARAADLLDVGESDPKNWLEPFKNKTVDGVIIVASDEAKSADDLASNLRTEANQMGINFVGIEIGTALTNADNKHIEHFGFRDGVSQPLIDGVDNKKAQRPGQQTKLFKPEEFVLSDLSGEQAWANEGSFMVYRRLRQDVKRFWQFMEEQSASLGMSPEKLGAKFVGRWKSGAALANHADNDPGGDASEENSFTFMDDDPDGKITPRFSHIRKSYPRGDGFFNTIDQNREANDKHRILRRAIPYGKKIEEDPNEKDRGLLFICFQKDIGRQFEFIQMAWVNKTDFPKLDNGTEPGHDPIIGQHKVIDGKGTGFTNLKQDDGTFKRIPQTGGFKQWVTTTGGEYFFSPSISALKNL